MIELKRSGDDADKPEMVDLFSIDGTAYQVPKKPRVNVALQYLTDARRFGEELAQMMLLEKLLGEDGYRALSEYEDLTPEQLSQVSDKAAALTLGQLESGNGGRGSKKSRG